jgi:hypothetical protein
MHPQKRRISAFEIVVAVIAAGLVGFIALAFVLSSRFTEKRDIAKGVSNCRQIARAWKTHLSNFGGSYWDGAELMDNRPEDLTTANKFFRILFQAETICDESIFGCPQSPYQPDGNIGTAPHFNDALSPGENHWMMTPLSDSASGTIPLVYENAAVAAWNPRWNVDVKGKPVPGRTWSSGIIVGMNDGSVTIQRLAADQGAEVPLKNLPGSDMNLFTQHDSEDGETFEVLDIERRSSE